MARPKKPTDELKDQRVPIMMSPGELQDLDDWMHQHRIRSRGEAIRRLCHIGVHVLPDIESFLDSSKRAYDHFGDAIRASSDKSDAEKLEIYENLMAAAIPDLLQSVIDAHALKGIFESASHGETIDEALREAVRVLDETLDLSKRVMNMGDGPEKTGGDG